MAIDVNSWSGLSELLHLMGISLQAEWRCNLPLRGAMPSDEADGACDIWCRQLAKQLTDWKIEPPQVLKPWILVRVATAAAAAKIYADTGQTGPGLFSPARVERMLVEEWHLTLKVMWP